MQEAFRAPLLHCIADPGQSGSSSAVEYLDDGVLIVEDGCIVDVGAAETLLGDAGSLQVHDHRDKLIVPGFIDCHVHFPQLDIIAAYGTQLLDWLQNYAFPIEKKLADRAYADEIAAVFLDGLLENGTTSALVFGTVHEHSADAIFEAAEARDMRIIAGKVLMDRNCPDDLRDDATKAYTESKALIERWHGKSRLGYAITPRFALTSSDEQLAAAGKLAGEFPDVWIHTHLSENLAEVEAVADLFPDRRSYLDVYDYFGLLRERSVFAHCLHLDEADRSCMATAGAAAAFCPTSNLFLGSGLFDLEAMRSNGIRCGLGTDVGGGTSLSMLRTASEAYKVSQLRGQTLPATRALFLATLGAAEALYIDDKVGNFVVGKEADFVVLDPAATSLTERRTGLAPSIDEKLFALLMLGDDRHVAATYVAGQLQSGVK